jgi:hypothetical protein
MARARNIKPGFFKNENLAELSPLTRILFIGLWCIADREGRLEDRPKRIRAEILPYDDGSVEQMLQDLHDAGFVQRYTVGDQGYIGISNFAKHQMPHHKEVASVIPPPPGSPAITRHPHDVPDSLRKEVFERDGGKCLRCGSTEHLSVDHITPLANGGTNDKDNLQTLCKKCNSIKGVATKDYRQSNVEPTLSQRCFNDGSSKSLLAVLIPDSLNLIPDSLNPIPEQAASANDQKGASAKNPIPDFENVDEAIVKDFLALRKAKKSPVTQTAINGIKREAAKAKLSLEQALEICCIRGWQGFKAEWVKNDNKPQQQGSFDPVAFVNQNRGSNGNEQPYFDDFIDCQHERLA